jgi:hypothetical protein
MEVAITLDLYATAKITAIKSFIVRAPGQVVFWFITFLEKILPLSLVKFFIEREKNYRII